MLTDTVSKPMRIVGGQYAGALDLIAQMNVGDDVILRPEPTNRHDVNAIEVLYDGHKLGYIERAQAPMVRTLIAKGWVDRAIISRNDPRKDLYNMLWCVIEHKKVLDPCDELGPVVTSTTKAENGEKHVWSIHERGCSYQRVDTQARPYKVLEIRMELTDSTTRNCYGR